MDVAITGSTGFIGSALRASLEADGHRVIALRRPQSSSTRGDAIAWDPAAGTIDQGGLEGVDAIVHLAGEGIEERRWTDEQKQRILDSRVQSTSLLARTIDELDRPPAVWVSGSAIGYYGDRGDEVLTESDPPGDDFLAEVCQRWEAEARAERTRVATIRTGIVLDPDGGALQAQLPFFKLGIGGRIGDGSQWWSWITLADQVAAIRHLLDHEVSGPFNLTAPNPVTNAVFTSSLGDALHRPTFLPTPKLATYARLGKELAQALLYTSARVVPSALQESGFTFADPELGPALESMFST